jgi:hypothetical protein
MEDGSALSGGGRTTDPDRVEASFPGIPSGRKRRLARIRGKMSRGAGWGGRAEKGIRRNTPAAPGRPADVRAETSQQAPDSLSSIDLKIEDVFW